MEYEALIREIASKVTMQLAKETETGGRAKLLVLGSPSEISSAAFKRLSERYEMIVAAEGNACISLDDIEAVVLCKLSNQLLSRVAAGLGDTYDSELLIRGILSGKSVYVVSEGVELFAYKSTAPAAYYSMMLDKAELLRRSGVHFVDIDTLADLDSASCAPPLPAPPAADERQDRVERYQSRVLSERAVISIRQSGITLIHVTARCIITDLAREYADKHGMKIVREK